MAHHPEPVLRDDDKRRLGAGARSFGLTSIVVGVAGLAAAAGLSQVTDGGWERLGFAYVTNYSYFLSIMLGGLFFVLVTHLFRAGWVVAVRRIAEVIAGSMPVMAVLFVPILLYVFMGNGMVYPWAARSFDRPAEEEHASAVVPDAQIVAVSNGVDNNYYAHAGGQTEESAEGAAAEGGDEGHGDHAGHPDHIHGGGGEFAEARVESHEAATEEVVPGKRPYLTRGFFAVRWVGYLLIWSALGIYFLKNSVAQESGNAVKLTRKLEVLSAPGMLLFALTITLAAFDLLMSLDPVWFSTMWGVYYFAGSALSTVAVIILAIMILQRFGYLPSVSVEHYHDLGKLLFMFVFFWGYIAFSQYMLIWYGNLAEETYFFERRGVTTQAGNPFYSGWTVVALVLLFGHLLIPFLGLLSRWAKRSRKILAFWAVWMLAMHWVDQWWVVMPNYSSPDVPWPTVELLCLVGIGGVAVGATVLRATRQGLIAAGDPRLGDSLSHVNPY